MLTQLTHDISKPFSRRRWLAVRSFILGIIVAVDALFALTFLQRPWP